MSTVLKNLFWVLFLYPIFVTSQVGINTTNPSPDAALDVTSGNKGILIPRVDINNLGTIAPITGGNTEGLLVYNTNVITGKGFYFWDGGNWQKLALSDDSWTLNGNSGTIGINYIGTTDNRRFRLGTNGLPRLVISTSGNLLVEQFGSANNPIIAWQSDTGTGIWRSQFRHLNFSSGGTELLELDGAGARSVRINAPENDVDFIVATNNDTNALFVNGANNNVGIGLDNPQFKLDVNGDINASGEVRNSGVILTSDKRLKNNIEPIIAPLKILDKLNPVTYHKKQSIQETSYPKKEYGFIAQELQKILPELVKPDTSEEQLLGVDYTSLIAIMVKGIQEQSEEIKLLKKEIAALKKLTKQ